MTVKEEYEGKNVFEPFRKRSLDQEQVETLVADHFYTGDAECIQTKMDEQ